jgi:hypothetical protein
MPTLPDGYEGDAVLEVALHVGDAPSEGSLINRVFSLLSEKEKDFFSKDEPIYSIDSPRMQHIKLSAFFEKQGRPRSASILLDTNGLDQGAHVNSAHGTYVMAPIAAPLLEEVLAQTFVIFDLGFECRMVFDHILRIWLSPGPGELLAKGTPNSLVLKSMMPASELAAREARFRPTYEEQRKNILKVIATPLHKKKDKKNFPRAENPKGGGRRLPRPPDRQSPLPSRPSG